MAVTFIAMKTIELIGFVDEHRHLTGEVPQSVSPGPVRLQVLIDPLSQPLVDLAEVEWECAIGREWVAEWSDPREDIYTLNDGKPIDDEG